MGKDLSIPYPIVFGKLFWQFKKYCYSDNGLMIKNSTVFMIKASQINVTVKTTSLFFTGGKKERKKYLPEADLANE